MIRALWYLLQIAVLTGVVGWLLQQGGRFDLHLGPWRIEGESPVLIILAILVLLVFLTCHRVYLWIVHFPRTWHRYRRDIRLTKGHQALVRSLTALASGDQRLAHYQAWRAQKLLPEFSAVPHILIATTSEQQGKADETEAALRALLKTEARDLGVRGLVQRALANGEWERGLILAREGLAQTPRAPMLQRLVYDLECQNEEFAPALNRQRFLMRYRAMTLAEAQHDAVMLSTALARAAQHAGDRRLALRHARHAVSLDPSFVPAACELVDILRGFNKGRAAMIALEKTFTLNPHPDLIERWTLMAPQGGSPKEMTRRLRWFEKLLALRPDSVHGQLMMARVAMEESLWGEARAYLDMAVQLKPCMAVYKARARYHDAQQDAKSAHDDLERATNAEPDPVWYDPMTGKVFDRWIPVILPERRFGTVIWGVPGRAVVSSAPQLSGTATAG
jgi:HemY protein